MKSLSIFIIIFLLNISISAAAKSSSPGEAFTEIILNELKLYPEMQIQDLYKLGYQASYGSYHEAFDSVMAREWLDKEWDETPASTDLPVVEQINFSGNLVRVNIAAYKREGGAKETLLKAFINTAEKFTGSQATLIKYWEELTELSSKGIVKFEEEELSQYFQVKLNEKLPAVHHSSVYMDLYKPAYRVVIKDYIK